MVQLNCLHENIFYEDKILIYDSLLSVSLTQRKVVTTLKIYTITAYKKLRYNTYNMFLWRNMKTMFSIPCYLQLFKTCHFSPYMYIENKAEFGYFKNLMTDIYDAKGYKK